MKPRYNHTCRSCILLDRIKVGEKEIDLYHHTGEPKNGIYFRWGHGGSEEGSVRFVDGETMSIYGISRWTNCIKEARCIEEARNVLRSALIEWRRSSCLHPRQVMLIGKE